MISKDLMIEVLDSHQLSKEELTNVVDNEVLLLLQEELKTMNEFLGDYHLLNSDKRISRGPQMIQNELFDTNSKNCITNIKCASFNSDKQSVTHPKIKGVNDENHSPNLFL